MGIVQAIIPYHFMRVIKKLILSLILFTGITIAAFAQHIYRGKVVDQVTLQPVEYASVTCDHPGKTAVTDKFGNFQLSLSTDSCTVKVTCIGCKTLFIKVHGDAKRFTIPMEHAVVDLNEVLISPHISNNSFHTISGLDLNLHPVNSSQELLRLVPGLFIAQHMGGGKAEQIFIRGFDADHGTDINLSVDGLPVNMVSHDHAQGYADLHFLIPETVSTYDFGKGPYYTAYGDFATAGYLSYTTKDAIDRSMIRLEAGQFNTARVMGMINLLNDKAKQKGQSAYVAGEYNYTDGPFNLPEHYKRFNLFGKFNTQLGENNKLTLSASTFATSWRASGEIPDRAASEGIVGRFGTIDSLQGGQSHRTNASVKLTSDLKNNFTLENQLYYTHYNFLLHVNSTFFAEDSVNGDAVRQHEVRDMYGYNGKLTHQKYWENNLLTTTAGIGARLDRIYGSELVHTINQNTVIAADQLGDINENNLNGYFDESLESGKWLFNVGARIDYLHFNYHDRINEQVPSRSNVIISPKLNIQYTANEAIQFYVKAGKGFHSNDTRAVVFNNGLQTLPAAYGTDLGLNWKPIPHLYLNAAVWYLYLQQEFRYTDDGGVEPGGKTSRKGVDLSARYQLTKWLFANLNINLAKARLLDSLKGRGYVALAPSFTSTGGLDFKLKNGVNGGINYRYMHRRPGNNDYSLAAPGYYVTDLAVNYTTHRYELGLAIENLFNTKWTEFAAEENSRLKNEPAPVDQMSFTPGTPFFARVKITLFF
ncbi:TonB-dependent receptor [soil metagenome]|jgi:hypothetical protein